ncbi:hypothetical protein Val02_59800 [Virgisporangium aliadipatigenens]|uniref:DUF4012 domain-containing protein n=1 Tax=Virgisporangium aliadipatigenens TaxID=741659 RepID=A0A8J3YP22_9ACTN|nr:DUF4012 domain-containing protein [Virgisporangium aliadipatigenens]GIJ49094.1 hypothetical protein Val02_59800 [Virgisporangium aliadipatigenens]
MVETTSLPRVEPAEPVTPSPQRRRGALLGACVLVVAVAVAGTGVGRFGIQARDAAAHLTRAAALFQRLATDLREGRVGSATSTAAALRTETRAARDRTAGPLWGVAALAPGYGDDVRAVRTVADALDDLARDGIVPLARAVGGSALAAGGRIDPEALSRSAAAVLAADRAVRVARDRVVALPRGGLTRKLRRGVDGLRDLLDRAVTLSAPIARAAALAPPLLGADGPRTYLVVLQDNAELRATGGRAWAYVVLGVESGELSIVEQGTAETDLDATAADVNAGPHFPAAAAALRELYRRRHGRTVDGVLATDPVALSYLLRATGPVDVPGAEPLTAENAVRTLLSDTHATRDPRARDRYVAAAARAVFAALRRPGTDPRSTLAELDRAATERRLLLWSAHEAEQRLIAGTALAGTLPESDGDRPTLGVFLNDDTGGKLGYYLRQSVEVRVGDCRPDGRRELHATVALASTAPRRGLPERVRGRAGSAVARTAVSVFAPTGGAVDGATLDGRPVPIDARTERGRAVGTLSVDLAPGAHTLVGFTLLTADTRHGPRTVAPRLRTTPAATPWLTATGTAPRC